MPFWLLSLPLIRGIFSLFLLRFSCYLGVGSGEAGDGDVAGGLEPGDDDGCIRMTVSTVEVC